MTGSGTSSRENARRASLFVIVKNALRYLTFPRAPKHRRTPSTTCNTRNTRTKGLDAPAHPRTRTKREPRTAFKDAPAARALAPQTNPPHAHTTRQPASRHTLTHRTHAPHAYPASAQPRPELRLEEAGAVGAARVGREVAKVGEAADVSVRVGTSPPGANRRAPRV